MRPTPGRARRLPVGRAVGGAVTALAVVLVVVVIVVVAAVRNGDDVPSGELLVADAAFPSALAPIAGGGLLYGERLTGRVIEIDATGRPAAAPVAQLDVSTSGQRGLLGLVVDDAGRTFAAWTEAELPAMRLVVGQVAPGPVRIVWDGPPSTELGNGGHLELAPDRSLVIGVGDLQDGALADDPGSVNGKLLALDPDGPPDQVPVVLSSGWTNPFAFTFTPSGTLWVVDNSVGDARERLALGDAGGRIPVSVLEFDQTLAPSGLAAVDDTHLALCGFVSRRLDLLRLDGEAGATTGAVLADACAVAVTRLNDGRLAYADETSIWTIEAG